MRVAVAMSGGMDSTAAALILKREGHEIVGFHMLLHRESEVALLNARKAAEELGVPLHVVDLSREFKQLVIDPFIEQYSAGLTPSPCPVCNRRIKLGLLFDRAREFGCEKQATGHYARIIESSGTPGLFRGRDISKDQSYFLFDIPEEALERTIFPLGEYSKNQIRDILRQESISAAESQESQELCFISDGDYRGFLESNNIFSKPGDIVNARGELLGRHTGITKFTVGQRRGIGLCAPRPLYVIRIDAAANTVTVGFREETFRDSLTIRKLNVFSSFVPLGGKKFSIKVRSTSRPVDCTVVRHLQDSLDIKLDAPQSGIAPGQAGVLYLGDRVVGGGWISD